MRRYLPAIAIVLPSLILVPRQSGVTFDEIAPTIYRSCAPCHSPGGSAPFSLSNYEEVRRRAERIGLNVISRAMPPCQVKSDFGQFSSVPGLSESEMVAIRTWATTGAKPGTLNPSPPPQRERVWRLGKPDLVLKSGKVSAATEGGIQWIFVRLRMPKSGVIRGFEIRPADPRTIRQATIGWAKPGVSIAKGSTVLPHAAHPIGAWAFGYYTWRAPRGSGIAVTAGSEVVVRLQCQALGKQGDASFRLAVYFEDKTADPLEWLTLEERNFVVEKGEKLQLEAEATLKEAAAVISLLPEFRYACEQVDLTATLPDGTIRNLFAGRWDVYWVGAYNFIEPPLLPSGTRLRLTALYNNGFDAAHGADTRLPIVSGDGPRDEACRMSVLLKQVRQ